MSKQQLHSQNFYLQPLLSTEGSKNLGSWLLLLASLPSLDKRESQGAALTLASWPSSQKDSPPTVKVRAQHCPVALPFQQQGAGADPASPAPTGVSLGPGPTPAGGLQLSVSFVLLGMQQARETSASPTRALNCRVNFKVLMSD